jgi:F-type H+-transporting ATPase subunit b
VRRLAPSSKTTRNATRRRSVFLALFGDAAASCGLIVVLALTFGLAVFAQEHAPSPADRATNPAKEDSANGNEGHLEAWKWANFLILAGVLGWMIAKKAPAFFESRTEEIQRGIAEATKARQEAEARAAKMELRMASLQSEIEHVRADAKAEMAREVDRIRKETGQHIARIQAHGEQEIVAATKHAEKDLRAFSAQLAIQLAEQRIRARMSAGTQNALVDGFLKQLDRRNSTPEARL